MSQSFQASIAPDASGPALRALLTDNDGAVQSPANLVSGSSGFPTLLRQLVNGTGAGQANKFWYTASRALAAGANDDWVLNGGTLKDRFGNAVSLTTIVYVLMRLRSPATGVRLLLGNAGSNPWAGWWGGGTTTLTVRTWLQQLDDIDGMPVNPGDTLRVRNPGGASTNYDLVLIGRG